jgi:hypothetical protein
VEGPVAIDLQAVYCAWLWLCPVQVSVYLHSHSGVAHSGSKAFAAASPVFFLQPNKLVFLQYTKKQDTYMNISGKVYVIN